MVEDGAHFFQENLNLEGHLNCFIGSKVTAILVNEGFYLLVELPREGSAPGACAAGLFVLKESCIRELLNFLRCAENSTNTKTDTKGQKRHTDVCAVSAPSCSCNPVFVVLPNAKL